MTATLTQDELTTISISEPNKPKLNKPNSTEETNKVCLAPIGLFDSGIGGLSVYLHLKQVLPNEHYIYYADTLNVPYGTRSSENITQLTLKAVSWLVNAGCKIIVIACNSASAYALKLARDVHPNIPIVGLVPALKPAVMNSRSKSVAVLATQATLDGALLNTVISDYADPAGVKVVKWFDPELVPWVEAGMPIESDTANRLKAQLHQFAKQQVDHLVLGCTHYPFFRDFITKEIQTNHLGITVLDSGAAIATRVKEVLRSENKLLNSGDRLGSGLTAGSVNQGFTINVVNSENQNNNFIHDVLAERENLDKYLDFYITDYKADLNEVAKLVERLIT